MEGIQTNYAYRAAALLTKFLHHSLNDEESRELEGWVKRNEINRRLFEDLKNEEKLESALKDWQNHDLVSAFDRIQKRIRSRDTLMRNMQILHWASAILAILLSIVLWIFVEGSKQAGHH